ncbi:hypothetical protein VTL71DRAFT_8119 [Oculimacula yallundae]|uniref:Uncharacterized protein n=1 Tax=Oculimacula yallundae TaxID=86028 RepID=A0ABR4CYZ2_9HELO
MWNLWLRANLAVLDFLDITFWPRDSDVDLSVCYVGGSQSSKQSSKSSNILIVNLRLINPSIFQIALSTSLLALPISPLSS